jgi:hypothetical protein
MMNGMKSAVAYFKAISRCTSGETEEGHTLVGRADTYPGFESATFECHSDRYRCCKPLVNYSYYGWTSLPQPERLNEIFKARL